MSLQAALMAVVVPYAAIAVAGWRGLREHRRRTEAPEAPPRPGFVLGRTRLSVEAVPVRAAVADALRSLDRVAARQLTRLNVAAADGLVVRADPLALHDVLADVVGGAVGRAPCGSVLVSARAHGGRIEICVLDDGSAPAVDALSAASDSSRQILALHGATLEARPGAHGGTEVALRLLAPAERARPAAAPAAPAPARPEQDAQGSTRNSPVGRSVRSSSSSEVGTT